MGPPDWIEGHFSVHASEHSSTTEQHMTARESQGQKAVLVTGACGEIGQALVQELAARGGYRIVTADIAPLPDVIMPAVTEHVQGDLIYKIKTLYDYDFDLIFHLAASLSSKAEVATEEAHRINVEGTMQLLCWAAHCSEVPQVREVTVSQLHSGLWPDSQRKALRRARP
jgi:hypothetical protein